MSWTHLHLLLNHILVLGSIFGLLLLVVAMMRRSAELKKVSLGVFIIAAPFAIPVYISRATSQKMRLRISPVSQNQSWISIRSGR